MEQWTSSGEHRLCCLRCGHLFGYSCIIRWLQHSNSANRSCPQCKAKASIKHVRTLYAKKLTAIDTSEYDKLKTELKNVSTEKKRIEIELSHHLVRQRIYESQLDDMRKRITELEGQLENTPHKSQDVLNLSRKFYLDRTIEICKESGCRVFDYNPWYKILAVSQKSINSLFNGYGIRKIDCEYFNVRQFVCLHLGVIRDLTFHPSQPTLLLSVGFDKYARLMDIQSNMTVHTYQTECSLWSCCWSGDNPNIFLTGAQNGLITEFDIRQTSGAVRIVDGRPDVSPVVSMAMVPPNPNSGISRGGFVACSLNTCYAYEVRDAAYIPKQVFLEGPFISVRYDAKHNHYLISSRPNARQLQARHTVCTIEKNVDFDTIYCNTIHTFRAGNTQQLLSRPCYLYTENDTLVAAYAESSSNISLWSTANGTQLHSLPVSDPVMDLCSFEANNNLFLATLSSKKLRLYNYGHKLT